MKAIVQKYQSSLYETDKLNAGESSAIWDFYVSKSPAASAAQKRSANDYGLKEFPYEEMLNLSGFSSTNQEMLMATDIAGVLNELDLTIEHKDKGSGNKTPVEIDIDTPRFVCMQRFNIKDRSKQASPSISKSITLLTHIRNSLAHGCTYFLPNENILLQDKVNGNTGKVTAMILMPATCLIAWIRLIDYTGKFYFPEDTRADLTLSIAKLKRAENIGR